MQAISEYLKKMSKDELRLPSVKDYFNDEAAAEEWLFEMHNFEWFLLTWLVVICLFFLKLLTRGRIQTK